MVREDHIGWLKCDGRALSTVEYRGLFNVLGYEFGGSGAYFNLPNSQGRVMGLIGQSDITTWVDGDISGEETHTLTIAELPAHNHDISGGPLDVSNGVVPTADGETSTEATGITVDLCGAHIHSGTALTAGAHAHTVNWTSVDDANFSGIVPAIPNSDTGSVMPPYSGIVNSAGDHTHTLSIDSAGAHIHTITDPKHNHTIASNGGSLPHNNMQPTLFLGNLFIYGGLFTKNIAGPDGVSISTVNRSHYPPAAPAIRLY